MATQQEDRKYNRPKYEEKNKVTRKFEFIFDEDKVTYRTEIPELPAKPKTKPNAQSHKKAIEQIQNKSQELKQERKKKKDQLKKGSQNYDEDISKLEKNVGLGKKCLVVLRYDQDIVTKSLLDIEEKLEKKARLIRNLLRGPRQNKQERKNYEEMTYEEIEAEQQRLSTRVSTASLSKKQETEINALLSKLTRLKSNAPHGEKHKDNTESIQNAHDAISRLKVVKESLQRESEEIKQKIEAIQQDIEEYGDKIDELEQQKKNPENEQLVDQCKQLKDQIYKLREEKTKLEQEFEDRRIEYEREQAKIQWIKWATDIQKKKNEEWEADKEERRKQRLKEKNKQKNNDGTAPPQGQKGTEEKPQRKRPNKHQKEIDNCAFLISYCEGLIQKDDKKEQQANQAQGSKNVQTTLQSGEWSKMKGIQLVKSKKQNLDEQEKVEKPKKKKAEKKESESNTEKAPTTFTHQFFTQHAFDSVRVVPPSKPEEVSEIIKQLNQKLVYYLEHPEGAPGEQRQEREKERDNERDNEKGKQKYAAKGKYQHRQKKAINTEEFPSLQ